MPALVGAVKRLGAPPPRDGVVVATIENDGGVHRSGNLEPRSPSSRQHGFC
jgi:hypothetical protein